MHKDDPKKRPLLTDKQLAVVRRANRSEKKATPREEFEKLFRPIVPDPISD
jgi:hypothetical protein